MNLVERVARAICESTDGPWEFHNEYGHAASLVQARAAIAKVLDAMMDPSDGMICVGIVERHDQPVPEAWSLATVHIWQAMLAQLRKEALGE